MAKQFLTIGSILAAITVAIGAFGSHGLKEILTQNQRLDTFEVAVRYQFYHTFAILLVGVLLLHFKENRLFLWVGRLFLVGILIFSGSLYVLCITNITWLGAITPLGGLAFIIGWGLLAWEMAKRKLDEKEGS
jgi:uncharacterized membrane protein YgdD (TMEM256/DUF423 family)